MSKWTITKEMGFCYGHSVWSQELNTEYSLDGKLCCRHMHGHEGLIRVSLAGTELNNGMVTDFKHLNWFKKWIDEELDHKFIMDLNDPLLPHEVPILANYLGGIDRLQLFDKLDKQPEGHYTIWPEYYSDFPQRVQEKYEGMVFVDFVPTSEHLSKWLFEIVQEKMSKINVNVESLQFYETPKSQSVYYK
jgi:6-pyruvoyltetrahydropterin/6-carboxytetrahydropterin synthase